MTAYPLHHPAFCIRTYSMLILAWLIIAVTLSATGLLATGTGLWSLSMPVLIALPILAFTWLYQVNSLFRARVLSIDTGVLVILHSWRMVGMGFLFLYAFDVLPGLFAGLAGVGDMLAAFSALLIGTALLRGRTVSRKTLLVWNSLGLFDFVVAVVVGTSLRSIYLGGAITTDAMAQLPLSLVPTIVVPLYIITHLIIFLQLAQAEPDIEANTAGADNFR